ncbi:hypothetical protein E2C00_20880 [Streptomyces sp. WAC05374]|uniref:hypothetical protein n=1 Tax=Streptomyces sp. WAC05374 TaxID=2487420 RepID=UPI000F88A0D8|nr:hypothetical protein [Streptomyces sp. WAC05374]RST19126.1 hypothetical protein EF905_02415 [Streptomyces sp. WAC05374]TDF38105.1 hypothetical protein E2B92_28455 [Streptomyces sp. WAC05374]TDF53564.1 hypothetical protein E2C00_20880 [Streptomyces sp. WAC05374]TDF59411.1 hypothetical protein E2C02_06360 [Streptomyces sp. WAC05374]
MNEPIIARHWLAIIAPKAAPALATSTVLILARIWNANGAEHSVGNAVLMTALSLGAAAAGVCASVGRAGDSAIAGTAFAASGGLALAGVAGYADGLSLPLLLWVLATAVAYGLAARYWRTDRRERVAYDRQTSARREEHAHIERVEALRAGAQIEVARTSAAYTEQLAQALITRAALTGFDFKAVEAAGLPELPSINTSKEH